MAESAVRDIEFTLARLHGRRSNLADGARLDELCRIRTVSELSRRLFPDAPAGAATRDFQRRVILGYVSELSGLAAGMPGAPAAFLDWQRERFSVENLKVLARGTFAKMAPEKIAGHMVVLPGAAVPAMELHPRGVVPGSEIFLEAFLEAIREPVLRSAVERVRPLWLKSQDVFLLESALDCGYHAEAVWRAAACGEDDEDGGALALASLEASLFLLMLAVRGVQGYKLSPDLLRSFYFKGSALSADRYERLLRGPGPRAVADIAGEIFGAAVPGEAPSAADIEAVAWTRYLHLSNRLFRRGHMEARAVFGYAGVRRVELMNLVSLSEGLRLGVEPRRLRARLIPRSTGREDSDV